MRTSFVILAALPAAVAALGAWLSIGGRGRKKKCKVPNGELQSDDTGLAASGKPKARKSRIASALINFAQGVKGPNKYEILDSCSDDEADHRGAAHGEDEKSAPASPSADHVGAAIGKEENSAPALPPAAQGRAAHGKDENSASAPPPAGPALSGSEPDLIDLNTKLPNPPVMVTMENQVIVTKEYLPNVGPDAWICAIGERTEFSCKWDAATQKLFFFYGFDSAGNPFVTKDAMERLTIQEFRASPPSVLRACRRPAAFIFAMMLETTTPKEPSGVVMRAMHTMGEEERTLAVYREYQNGKIDARKLKDEATAKLSGSLERVGNGSSTLVVYLKTPSPFLSRNHVAALRNYCEDPSEDNKRAVVHDFKGKLSQAVVIALPGLTIRGL